MAIVLPKNIPVILSLYDNVALNVVGSMWYSSVVGTTVIDWPSYSSLTTSLGSIFHVVPGTPTEIVWPEYDTTAESDAIWYAPLDESSPE